MTADNIWKFWIDVGGTFTDCLARHPDGAERYLKVLSSGITKGRFQATSVPHELLAADRDEPPDFWVGAELRLLDDRGNVLHRSKVVGFSSPGLPSNGRSDEDQILTKAITRSPWQLGPFAVEDACPWSSVEGMLLEQGFVAYELDGCIPAPLLAIHRIMGWPLDGKLPDVSIDLGTTKGTNALLTRNGARTALITSRGFEDFLAIGDQARENLFALNASSPQPLYETAIAINERVLCDGKVELVPDWEIVQKQLQQLQQAGIESLAICLMFGYRYPEHERKVASIASSLGFRTVRCSCDVAPLIKIVPRGETTVLDAYLDPVICEYLNQIQSGLSPGSRLRLMTSSGGLVTRERFSGKDSVLSGPAGGVVGAVRVGQQAGFQRVIGFDMGGTSTDVSRFEGEFSRTFETRKGGVRMVHPMLDVETVAAGGGSVCWFDGTRLRVGPHSAGADPGPACYGCGGPLAVTDINLYLGRLNQDWFPFPLYPEGVEQGLEALRSQLLDAGYELSRQEIATGLWQIANHSMATAIESISVARGFDPRTYLLVSFGGAAAQHCCGVADQLGMKQILDHPRASILSAVGIQLADQSAHAVIGLNWILREARDSNLLRTQQLCEQVIPQLIDSAVQALIDDGVLAETIRFRFSLDLRYQGTESYLNISGGELQARFSEFQNLDSEKWPVDFSQLNPGLGTLLEEFDRQHRHQFGYSQQRPIEVVAGRLEACFPGPELPSLTYPGSFEVRLDYQPKATGGGIESICQDSFNSDSEGGCFLRVDRDQLLPGDLILGPAIIADRHSTTVVDAGWQGKALGGGVLLLAKIDSVDPASESIQSSPTFAKADPIQLEIFNQYFSSIASQMGSVLQKTSVSVNVKERLDFSCAIFSRQGELVVNAPHIPVHLGAMGQTVRHIIDSNPHPQPGDVFVTNDPYAGGSHLPDITVVTPVFPANAEAEFISHKGLPWFWVACRSHHAEIGGMTPGSMPANATCLAEEGVLIQNFRLIEGRFLGSDPVGGDQPPRPIDRFDDLRKLLKSPPFPSRSPEENIADIQAQVAANQTGVNRLRELVDRYGFDQVSAYMTHIQAAAEDKTRQALLGLKDGLFSWEDQLDNGAKIKVSLRKNQDQLTIDFAGTSPVQPDNLNANSAIVEAAVMYVVRLLIAEEIPLNEGILKPVEIKLPDCFLNPIVRVVTAHGDSTQLPAIVGGNVETSQRIVDCLLGALGLAAASQGTMNNWLMGDGTFGYYETVGGGSGATSAGPGANAIHSHMTNTRLTDPEILESRYPVILREFGIRKGSGGEGRFPGGQGMVREVEFLKELTLSLLTSRRNSSPYGMAGGGSGAAGRNLLLPAGQHWELTEAKASVPPQHRDPLQGEQGQVQRVEPIDAAGTGGDGGNVDESVETRGGYTLLPSRCEWQVKPGDRLRLETPGGGGWGKP